MKHLNMIRTLLLLLLALGFQGAFAGPDFTPYQPTGWQDRVMPSPENTQGANSVFLPSYLNGDETSYLAFCYINDGDSQGSAFVYSLRIDEQVRVNNSRQLQPNYYYAHWNIGQTISGGRHTLWQTLDPDNLVAEDNESNNTHGRQWVWDPQELHSNTQVVRSSPPHRTAGHQTLPAGVTAYPNRDGMLVSGEGEVWRAYAISWDSPDPDYDICLYEPSFGVNDGFDNNTLAVSNVGGAALDAVIVKGAYSPGAPYNVGILNWDGSGDPYRLESRISQGDIDPGQTVSRTLAANQMIHLEELNVQPHAVGSLSLIMDVENLDQPLTLAVFHKDFTEGNIRDAINSTTIDSTGRHRFDFEVSEYGDYGLAVYRSAYQGTNAISYELSFYKPMADLAAVTLTGSHAPLVPYIELDGGVGSPQSAPEMLEGEVSSTNLYHHFANIGTRDTQPNMIGFKVDGNIAGELDNPYGDDLEPDPSVIYTFGYGPFNVPGGRHTVTVWDDSQEQMPEFDEQNNLYAEQWIWNPVQLSPDMSMIRQAPPVRHGGTEDIPAEMTVHDNLDAMRSQTFEIEGNTGFWGAVAILAAGNADLDIGVYAPSTGAQDGFVNSLKNSTFGSSICDYVLLDFDGALDTGQAWDLGVLRYSGETDYALQSTRSQLIFTVDPEDGNQYGPGTIGSGEALALYEFRVLAEDEGESITIHLDNAGGGADLRFTAFARNQASGFYNGNNALALANSGGAGQDETLVLEDVEAGYYGLLVSKSNHEDFARTATFSLEIQGSNLSPVPDEGVDLPAVSRIEGVYPNPFNPQTTVKLALRQAGRAAVKIYDLQGRLVKTLFDGEMAAGRHELVWTGRNHNGRTVPSGVYFVRVIHPDGMDQHRMSLVK